MTDPTARVEELERLAVENNKVLTCVFCGQQYPAGTPAWGTQVLVDHIKQCDAHPLRKVIKERDLLRDRIVVALEALDKKQYHEARLVLEEAAASYRS